MNDAKVKQQVVDKIKTSANILVTVSNDPSVDSLSAALALTLVLSRLGKHATAIFSGAVPPAITFLEPDKVFESTTDSLRDFIIALDKEKADHLRYKVEGDSVKIFITPYRTTITSDDLEFSQGDYNVELVIALGVENQSHLDAALEAHGRILHDATVVTMSAGAATSSLGSIDWQDPSASSLSEILVGLIESLKPEKEEKPLLDQQTATAILTGIVAETDRFSNTKTTARVMTIAAQLMAAGADQQLIASKLQETHEIGGNVNQNGETILAEDTSTNISSAYSAGGLSIGHEGETLEQITNNVKAAESILAPSPIPPPVTVAPLATSDDQAALQTAPISNAYALDPTEESIAAEQSQALPSAPIQPAVGSTLPVPSDTPTISSHAYMSDAPATTAPMNGVSDGTPPSAADIFADNTPAPAEPGSAMTAAYGPDPSLNPVADITPSEQPPLVDSRDASARDDALAAVHASFEAAASSTTPLSPGIVLPQPPPLPDFSAMAADSPYAPASASPNILGDILAPEQSPAPPITPVSPTDPGQFKIPGQ